MRLGYIHRIFNVVTIKKRGGIALNRTQVSIGPKDVRRNYLLMMIDSIGFPLGISFLSFTTILPMFLRQLTASDVLVGLIPAINNLGVFLPQIIIAPMISRLRVTKYYVVTVGMFERGPILLLAIAAWIWGGSNKPLVLWLFFLFFAIHSLSMGLNMPAYYSLLSKALPSERRGSLFGVGGCIGGILGVLGATMAGRVLSSYPFPIGYVFCFTIGFIILTISVMPLAMVREYAQEVQTNKTTLEALRELPSVLRNDKIFLNFILSQILWAIGAMAQAFFTVYAINRLSASASDVAVFTGITMGGGALANLVIGYIADRDGHKIILEATAILGALASFAPLISPTIPAMWLTFALTAIWAAGYGVSSGNIILDFAPTEDVPKYVGLVSVLTVPFRTLTPILAGLMIARWGYYPVFAASGISMLLAWAILRRGVPEPRRFRATGLQPQARSCSERSLP